MTDITIAEGTTYLGPTPAGAYFCISGVQATPIRRLLQSLLKESRAPLLNQAMLQDRTQLEDPQQALQVLYHAQKLGWVQGYPEPLACPEGTLENVLPDLLKELTIRGKVLLADEQGFYMASAGFPHEVAEELSALSADLASLHARRSGLLEDNLGFSGGAWAVVDAAGNGRIGFWPLYIGVHRFVLVVSGVPQFNSPAFVSLAWVLSRRYADMSA